MHNDLKTEPPHPLQPVDKEPLSLGPKPSTNDRLPTQMSRAVEVVFFEDRAEVTREATFELQKGSQWIALEGISSLINDRSIQAKISGGDAEILGVRVRRRFKSVGAFGREQVEAHEAEFYEASAELLRVEQDATRTAQEQEHLDDCITQWRDALQEIPRKSHEAEVIASWRAAFETLSDASLEAAQRQSHSRAHAQKLRMTCSRLSSLLACAEQSDPIMDTCVEVQVQSASDQSLQALITYRLPCALWRPEHLARLHLKDQGTGEVELTTWATVWQDTGERWDDIIATFSTARPAQIATPPLLREDILYTRPKTSEERRHITVNTYEEDIQSTGESTQSQNEMPGVDDGGEPLLLHATGKVSILSNGLPVRVEVAQRTLPAKVTRLVIPEHSNVAHLKATLSLTGSQPLLAGPLHLARGQGLMGRSKLRFISPSEEFEVGFGPDDGLRVRRKEEHRRDRKISGLKVRHRVVHIYLSNLSNTPRQVEIVERIPVSEIKEVQVNLIGDHSAWKLDQDGFLRRQIQLAPHETQKHSFEYEIRAAPRVILPF